MLDIYQYIHQWITNHNLNLHFIIVLFFFFRKFSKRKKPKFGEKPTYIGELRLKVCVFFVFFCRSCEDEDGEAWTWVKRSEGNTKQSTQQTQSENVWKQQTKTTHQETTAVNSSFISVLTSQLWQFLDFYFYSFLNLQHCFKLFIIFSIISRIIFPPHSGVYVSHRCAVDCRFAVKIGSNFGCKACAACVAMPRCLLFTVSMFPSIFNSMVMLVMLLYVSSIPHHILSLVSLRAPKHRHVSVVSRFSVAVPFLICRFFLWALNSLATL